MWLKDQAINLGFGFCNSVCVGFIIFPGDTHMLHVGNDYLASDGERKEWLIRTVRSRNV
jgi:hypothetical protein